MAKRTLVTGAGGMVGQQLMKLLPDAVGVDINTCDPRTLPLDLNSNYTVGFLQANRFDCVYHTAGMRGAATIGRTRGLDFLINNVKPTLGLIEALVRSGFKGRLLDVSSVGAYPGRLEKFREFDMEGPPHKSDFYGGHSKRFCELLCAAAKEQHGFDVVVVRPTAIFGPYDTAPAEEAMVINALIKRLEAGENPLVLKGNSQAARDFIYSPECARGMVMAMERGRGGEAYNLGTGQTVVVKDVAKALCELYGRGLHIEQGTDIGPSVRVMDMTKTARELGFRTVFTTKQLEETALWYRSHQQ